jgi:hypothetical protein
MTLLHEWEGFYVIVGSSAAALTGLMFVVVALGAERRKLAADSLEAFATPTVVHFCAALLVGAFVTMPRQTLGSLATCLLVASVVGLAYTLWTTVRARRQKSYDPVLEDWIFHVILPLLAYLSLLVAAIALRGGAEWSLYGIAGAALVLLFVGIHNAWDAATWIAMSTQQSESATSPSPPDSVARTPEPPATRAD